MLTQLNIRNFAIIGELDLDVTAGMTVFTGETGAGKSIIIEALGFALGDRADAVMLRAGAERGEVTAVFEPVSPALQLQLAELGLDGEECMLRRQINKDGRSRAWVNGSPVPVHVLRSLRTTLVEIHGQHEHQSLLRSEHQRSLLDGFGRHVDTLAEVRQCYARYRDIKMALEALQALGKSDEDARDLLRYQVEELQGLRITPEEIETLEHDQLRLANLTTLTETCTLAFAHLTTDDNSLQDQLAGLRRELADVQRFEPELATVMELVESAAINVEEAGRAIGQIIDGLDTDPRRLAEVEERLSTLHQLARKHRVSLRNLPEQLADLEARLGALETASARYTELLRDLDAAVLNYRQAAAQLTEERRQSAKRLAKSVTDALQGLGMPASALQVDISSQPTGDPAPEGQDRVEFQIRTNAGQPFRPLTKIASGGELSRISLAIQVCALGEKVVPTLVFDEVDSGISGRVAEIVGQLLRDLGEQRQVFCVTHLPQVASLCHTHMQVQKTSAGGATATTVTRLNEQARVEELARMLGGITITEQARGHAREMLERANAGYSVSH